MNVLDPNGYRVDGRYAVGIDSGLPARDLAPADLWYPNSAQTISDLDGNPYPSGSHLEGFIIAFDQSATEAGGQVVITNAQVRLICDQEGTTIDLFPIAIVSLSDASDLEYARFRFNSRDAIASQGGGNVRMAFEFVVPPNATPKAISIKNIRKDVQAASVGDSFASTGERDAAISTGALMGGRNILEDLIDTEAELVDLSATSGNNLRSVGIEVQTALPDRIVIRKGTQGSLEIDEDNNIIGGRQNFEPDSLRNAAGMEANLRVASFANPESRAIVQIDVSAGTLQSLLGPAAGAVANDEDPIRIIDSNGVTYPALGYIYRDDDIVRLRFTPDSPIRGLRQLRREDIELSRNNRAQSLILLFAPTDQITIEKFAIGNIVLAEYRPGFEVRARNR